MTRIQMLIEYVGSGCIAALECERLLAEEEEAGPEPM